MTTITKRTRKTHWKDGRPAYIIGGRLFRVAKIVSPGTDNTKTAKNASEEYEPYGVVLSPHKSAGAGNVCPHAGSCVSTCLDGTGRGAAKGDMGLMIHGSRIARTLAYYHEREWFLETLSSEIGLSLAQAARRGKRACFRLNMFSDVKWEKHGIPQAHPDAIFYDYTKNPRRVGQLCPNYWTTFSRDSHKDDALCHDLVAAGKNVAVVFDDGRTTGGRNLHGTSLNLPSSWNGLPCINGDTTDARWLDPRGTIVALRFKGHTTQSRLDALSSGFAIPIESDDDE